MILLMVFYVLSTLTRIESNTVTSPQIRNVATKASETRLIPHRVEYQNSFHPHYHQQTRHDQNNGPSSLKSYVIYDEYPLKIFKEWKANPPTEFSSSAPQNYLEFSRQPNTEFPPVYYFQSEQQVLSPPKPTLAYSSVYSNVIKVFEDSLNSLDRNRFQNEKYIKPFDGSIWKSQPPTEYESAYPQELPKRQLHNNYKLPENFPKVFSPNDKFHYPSFENGVREPTKFFYPQEGYYDTYTINYDRENTRHRDEVEFLPGIALKQKNQKKPFLCSFIRVNQRQFPENGSPCARSDDNLPLIPPEYPDYSGLPNDKIPLEHRRQHFQIKRIKRSELNESYESRQKRDAGFGYGYSGWGSPFNYESGYEGYFTDGYPSRRNYRNNYNSGYYGNRNRNQNYRNKYYSGGRYDEYDDDYQNNDDSNSRGLTGYLTNGGRRYKNRKNNSDDEDDDYDDNNNENNRDNDSDEEMERMNSNRRDTNDRRNNDDSRDRRRNNNNNNSNNNNSNNNNNNNDDDDYRDNRRNNNRNNSRRNNNNNRRNNDRYDYNSNRNRYYGNSNGYNNGYGSGYGSYGSNYGGNYGSGGYGSGYGSNGGYGYGGYGNGFGSF